MSDKIEKITIDVIENRDVYSQCVKNIFIALNKSTKAGVYELDEAHRLRNDLEVISNVVSQIINQKS